MQTAKKTLPIKQTMIMVCLIIAFCIYPLISRSLNICFGHDADSSKLDIITWIATKVEKDDYYVHEILHEQFALTDLNKAFFKVAGYCFHDDDISKSIFLKSYNYCILYVRQLLKNKDPPDGGVS